MAMERTKLESEASELSACLGQGSMVSLLWQNYITLIIMILSPYLGAVSLYTKNILVDDILAKIGKNEERECGKIGKSYF